MALTIVIVVIGILLTTSRTSQLRMLEDINIENSLAQCEKTIKEIERENRATSVDDSPSRLYFTWLSQECEMRAGPEFIIRKYTFFENGMFLLLRHHYAEESCSIATHTVTIQGSIKLLGPSSIVSGATETKYHVNTVNIVPLNRQVANKFGQKANLTCGPQPRWRCYVPEVIYEQPSVMPLRHGPIYNSLQAHSPTSNRPAVDCLKPFGIEFGELSLLRVQKKSFESKTFSGIAYRESRFELLLGSVAPNKQSRWIYRPTSLQPTAMVRADTMSGCPICSSISRGTECSPPLLHEVAALPALIGGYWLSDRCESSKGGIWLKRQLQVHSGDKLWTGQWDYYEDPQCSKFLYTITVAGSYVQRAARQRRHEEFAEELFSDYLRTLNVSARSFFKRSAIERIRRTTRNDRDNSNGLSRDKRESFEHTASPIGRIESAENDKAERRKRSSIDGAYQFLQDTQSSMMQSRFAAMLRGHQVRETVTRRPLISSTPSGTTELDLHIAESISFPRDMCNIDRIDAPLQNTWLKRCVPGVFEAPSTLGLRARLSVNWNGQYILLLGLRDDNLWEAPLRQCAQIAPYNPALRARLRMSVGLHFGLFSSALTCRISVWFLLLSQLSLSLYYLMQ